MGDFLSIPTIGSAQHRATVEQTTPMITAISESGASANLSGRMDSDAGNANSHGKHAGHHTPDALITPMPKQDVDLNTIAGPTPAFQVSIMELDAKLTEALALINAGNSCGRSEDQQDGPEEVATVEQMTGVLDGGFSSADAEDADIEAMKPAQRDPFPTSDNQQAKDDAADRLAEIEAKQAMADADAQSTVAEPTVPGETT